MPAGFRTVPVLYGGIQGSHWSSCVCPMAGGATVFADARAKAGNRVRTSQRLAFSGAFGLSGSGSFFCELDAKGFERGEAEGFLLAAEGVGLLRAKGTALCARLRAVRETATL